MCVDFCIDPNIFNRLINFTDRKNLCRTDSYKNGIRIEKWLPFPFRNIQAI